MARIWTEVAVAAVVGVERLVLRLLDFVMFQRAFMPIAVRNSPGAAVLTVNVVVRKLLVELCVLHGFDTAVRVGANRKKGCNERNRHNRKGDVTIHRDTMTWSSISTFFSLSHYCVWQQWE